jgi:PAS domain S-box-containing protein
MSRFKSHAALSKRKPTPHAGLSRPSLIRALKAEQGRVDGVEARSKLRRAKAAKARRSEQTELETLRTEIRLQRDQLAEHRRLLEETQSQYVDLFDFAPVGHLTLDERANILDINLAACSIFGRDREHFLGRPLAALVSRDDSRAFFGFMHKCRSSGQMQSRAFGFRSHGRTFQCYMWMQHVVRDHTFRAAAVDLTQQIGLENDRRLAREGERLAKATSEAKDEFIAMLSHELRTPLTPIVAAASLLCRRQDLPSDVIEQVRTIRRNAELEARLIDDLLDITRIRQNKLMLNPSAIDAHGVLSDTLEAFQEQIVSKALQVRLSLIAARHHVFADPVRLRQVFANLIDNAVKFTPPGGEIGVYSRCDEEQIAIAVRDSGVGMAPAVLEHLFTPFEKVPDDSRQLGGLGLGLAITKRLVDAQSGSIRATSEGRECGSLFEVSFPTVAAPQGGTGQASPPPQRAIAEKRPMTILIVEDHRDSAEMLAVLLSGEGHHVKIAANVRAALQVAHEGIDLIISDIALPDGTGLDLLRTLKAERPISGIALSGYGGAEIEKKSRQAGFSEHLVKPVNFERLIAVVNRVAQHV